MDNGGGSSSPSVAVAAVSSVFEVPDVTGRRSWRLVSVSTDKITRNGKHTTTDKFQRRSKAMDRYKQGDTCDYMARLGRLLP